MSTSKGIDQICCIALASVLLITFLFLHAEKLGVQAVSAEAGYESRLFNTSLVHSIDIVMDDWDSFLENCPDEKYETCAVIIDGETYRNVAIRAKGNTSLSLVESYENNRYSFKIEFDHYDNANTYHGLDKLCLNNIIQDNTYMKDYLTYQMMSSFGVAAPLCSYANITINGEDWGLYLAVEGIEDAFLQRNYGSQYGELYKPDSTTMGGGRGNGKQFEMPEDFDGKLPELSDYRTPENSNENLTDNFRQKPSDDSNFQPPDGFHQNKTDDFDGNMPDDFPMRAPDDFKKVAHDAPDGDNFGKDAMMGSDDVSLIYTDDEYDSYANIFENAKTDITDNDKSRLITSLRQLNENESIENIIQIEEVIRYFVVHNFVLNFDSYTGSMIHNYYLYEKDGSLSMIPWDYNLAFGGFLSESDASTLINYPIDTPVSGGTVDSRPMLAWIFADEEYTKLYHQLFAEFISTYFDSGLFSEMIDSLEDMIAAYVEKDATKFCTYEEFQNGVSTLKEFCLLRAESIQGQLNGDIPSTSDGQKQDTSSLIDGSHLVISAMGSMGNMMPPHGGSKKQS